MWKERETQFHMNFKLPLHPVSSIIRREKKQCAVNIYTVMSARTDDCLCLQWNLFCLCLPWLCQGAVIHSDSYTVDMCCTKHKCKPNAASLPQNAQSIVTSKVSGFFLACLTIALTSIHCGQSLTATQNQFMPDWPTLTRNSGMIRLIRMKLWSS